MGQQIGQVYVEELYVAVGQQFGVDALIHHARPEVSVNRRPLAACAGAFDIRVGATDHYECGVQEPYQFGDDGREQAMLESIHAIVVVSVPEGVLQPLLNVGYKL